MQATEMCEKQLFSLCCLQTLQMWILLTDIINVAQIFTFPFCSLTVKTLPTVNFNPLMVIFFIFLKSDIQGLK